MNRPKRKNSFFIQRNKRGDYVEKQVQTYILKNMEYLYKVNYFKGKQLFNVCYFSFILLHLSTLYNPFTSYVFNLILYTSY